MVVDVAEVDDVVRRDERQGAVRQLVEDLALGRHDVADLHQRPLEREEPLQRGASRLVDDAVLQVVDLVLQPIEDREVRIHQGVQERPQEEVRPPLQQRAGALAEVLGRPRIPRRRVRGQQEVPTQHEVDLVGLDLAVVDDGERHQVDVLAGQLQLRALVALLDVLGYQRVQPQLAGDRLGQLRRGVGQVDPAAGRRVRNDDLEGVETGEGPRAAFAPRLDPEPDRGLCPDPVRRG